MPSSAASSDTFEQFKKAFRSLFRRRKPVNNAPAVPKSQPPARPSRPQRPRSASAVAAPEVLPSPTQPSWPIFDHLQTAGGFYCSPVELPGSLALAPFLQQRSKSDVGLPPSRSDIFSELDATSLRRLSVIESDIAADDVPELDSPNPNVEQADRQSLNEASQAEDDQDAIAIEDEAKPEEAEPLEEPEEEVMMQTPEEEEDLVEPADVPIPEGSDSGMSERMHLSQLSYHVLIDTDLEDDSAVDTEQDFARNDSANGGKIDDDDSSSLYSTDESDFDADSATDDGATVSTPRTSSLEARNDFVEYFDEKIPVLAEPPQVARVTPAPGMAATSGPLNDFPFH